MHWIRSREHRQLTTRRRRAGAALAGSLAGLLLFSGVALAASPGAVDTSFGSGGAVSFGGGTQLFGVAAEADGGAVVAGSSGGRAMVKRLSSSGHVVSSWTGPAGAARAVAVAPDGSIAVTGTSGGAMLVARLSSSLSQTWTASAFPGQGATGYGVAIGPDGSVAAGGSINGGAAGFEAAAARFSASGARQWSNVFGFGGNSVIRGVAVQPADGKIVIAGSQNPGQPVNAVIGRLTTSGALDGSFAGGRGVTTYSFPGSGYTALTSVALQSNGQIVAAGSVAAGPVAIVLRINSNGTLDSHFGSGGASVAAAGQNVSIQSYPIGAYGVGIAAGGRVVAAGDFENTGVEVDQAIWGFTSGGGHETSFGSGGTLRGPSGIEACGLAIEPSGNIVTVGNTVTTLPDAVPCGIASGSSAYAARYVGFGPVPIPVLPLKASVKGLKGSYKKSSARKSGVKFTVACNEGCKIKVTLTGSKALAKKLHLGKKPIASASATLTAAGSKSLKLTGGTFRKALGSSKKAVKLSLKVVVTSAATGKSSTTKKTLTFR